MIILLSYTDNSFFCSNIGAPPCPPPPILLSLSIYLTYTHIITYGSRRGMSCEANRANRLFDDSVLNCIAFSNFQTHTQTHMYSAVNASNVEPKIVSQQIK